MKSAGTRKQSNFRLSNGTLKLLSSLSSRTGKSKTKLVEEAIYLHCKELRK